MPPEPQSLGLSLSLLYLFFRLFLSENYNNYHNISLFVFCLLSANILTRTTSVSKIWQFHLFPKKIVKLPFCACLGILFSLTWTETFGCEARQGTKRWSTGGGKNPSSASIKRQKQWRCGTVELQAHRD